MDNELSGFLQIGFEYVKDTHYRFTGELLTAVMLRDTPPKHQEQEAIDRLDSFIKAVENLLSTIDMIFYSYISERRLNI